MILRKAVVTGQVTFVTGSAEYAVRERRADVSTRAGSNTLRFACAFRAGGTACPTFIFIAVRGRRPIRDRAEALTLRGPQGHGLLDSTERCADYWIAIGTVLLVCGPC